MDSIYPDMRRPEIQVAYYLEELGLHWIYKSPVFLQDERKRTRILTPSFYLPKLGMYIEVCGWEKDYNVDYRYEIYRKNGVPVIFVHFYKERENWKRKRWKHFIVKRIQEIEAKRHEEIVKMTKAFSVSLDELTT